MCILICVVSCVQSTEMKVEIKPFRGCCSRGCKDLSEYLCDGRQCLSSFCAEDLESHTVECEDCKSTFCSHCLNKDFLPLCVDCGTRSCVSCSVKCSKCDKPMCKQCNIGRPCKECDSYDLGDELRQICDEWEKSTTELVGGLRKKLKRAVDVAERRKIKSRRIHKRICPAMRPENTNSD